MSKDKYGKVATWEYFVRPLLVLLILVLATMACDNGGGGTGGGPTGGGEPRTGTSTLKIYEGETAGDTIGDFKNAWPNREIISWSVGLDATGKPIEVHIEWREK